MVRLLLPLAVFLAALLPPASAQWAQTAGPSGADFTTLVALSETDLVAATRYGTAYAFSSGEWALQPDVKLPARMHRFGGLWFQVNDHALLVSEDQGVTWTSTGFQGEPEDIYVGPDAVYVSSPVAVYATTDGTTWAPAVTNLYVHLEDGNTTIEGTLKFNAFLVHDGTFMAPGHVGGHVGLFRTSDGGTTWSRDFPSPLITPKGFLARGDTLYAFGCYNYRSTDGGATWHELDVISPDGFSPCFDHVSGTETALYAGSPRHGAFRLDGDTWVQVHPTAYALSTHGAAAFVADVDGIYRKADGAATWEALPADLVARTAIPYSLGDHGALALTDRGLLYRSEDLHGWDGPDAFDGDGLRASALLVLPDGAAGPPVVLAATEDGVFRSADGGLTWAASNTGIAYHPFHLDKTPRFATNGEVILAGFNYGFAQQGGSGTSFGGIHRSDDGGLTWTSMNDTFPLDDEGWPARVMGVAMSGSTIVTATFEGPFASGDEGETWEPSTGLPIGLGGFIRTMYAAGDSFFALTTVGGLFESTDGGLTWHEQRNGIPLTLSLHDAQLFELDDELYLTVHKNGTGTTYRYVTGGWTLVEHDMPVGVRYVGFAPHGDLVLAGTVDAGVWTAPAALFHGPTVASEAGPEVAYALSAAHPNPTPGASRLTLTLGEERPVRIEMLDVLGRRVAVVQERRLPAGTHSVTLPTETLRAGTYLVRLAGPDFAEVRRVTVVR